MTAPALVRSASRARRSAGLSCHGASVRTKLASFLAVATLVAAGCGDLRRSDPAEEVSGSAAAACTRCHGGQDNDTGAPPFDLRGDPVSAAVGRHTAHLDRGVACVTCHPERPSVGTPGHLDGRVDVVFSGIAARAAGAPEPIFERQTGTCSAVYCHGATLQGGSVPAPSWTATSVACGSCHGLPPATGRHPGSFAPHAFMGTNCAFCHLRIVDDALQVVDHAKHVNGAKDVRLVTGTFDGASCTTACHGTDTRFPW
jgi:predicted CxxxxCH...CXXCH cytochrome family protein